MKLKKSYKLLILTLLMGVLLGLCGCGPNPKNFTHGDLTITLTDEFEEKTMDMFDAYYTAEHVAFTAREETDEVLEYAGYEINTLKDYCHEIVVLNGVNPSDLIQRGDYYYFTNTKTVSGANYTYIHCMFEGSNSYWICEFTCKTKDYDKYKDDIFKWADSITIKK